MKQAGSRWWVLGVWVATVSLMQPVFAQGDGPRLVREPQAPTATGSVSGHVTFADTQRPARFASVSFTSVEAARRESEDDDDRGPGRRGGSARTDLEGNFTASGLAPGDYYVTALASGYVNQAITLAARASAGAAEKDVLAGLPVVHVAANSLSQANVSLERGSVIAGRAMWDDGSPAAGVQVSAVSTTTTASDRNNGGFAGAFFAGNYGANYTQTDDRGNFRVAGLAPGEYFLRITVLAPTSTPGSDSRFSRSASAITLYAPGKLRKAEAVTLKLGPGEERGDVAFTIDLRALHRVSGRVSAPGATVTGGYVRLTDPQDATLSRSANVAADGTFALGYVPAGTYTLAVPYASTGAPVSNSRDRRQVDRTAFQPFQETISVTDTDVSGVAITLTPGVAAAK